MSKNPVLAANIGVANMRGEEQDASQQGPHDVFKEPPRQPVPGGLAAGHKDVCREAHLRIS